MNAREEILNAADKLFGKVGFDAATTREIAEIADVNKALIHYHFKNKEALYVAVLDRYYQQLGDILQPIMSKECEFREKMMELIDAYVDYLSQNINFSRIVQRESSGGKHMDRISGHLLPMFRAAVNLLEGAFPGTLSGDMAARQLLVSFYGIIVSYFTYSGVIEKLLDKNPFSESALESRKRHLHKMLDIVLNGIEGEEHDKQ